MRKRRIKLIPEKEPYRTFILSAACCGFESGKPINHDELPFAMLAEREGYGLLKLFADDNKETTKFFMFESMKSDILREEFPHSYNEKGKIS